MIGGLAITGLVPGEAGCGERCGVPGSTFGVWFDAPGRGNRVDRSITVDDVRVVYEHGPDCEDVIDEPLGQPANTTNLGKIVLIGCRGPVNVLDNQVGGIAGENGRTQRADFDFADGGPMAGIYVEASEQVVLRNNDISGIQGGRGGTGATVGGRGIGISLDRCTPGCVVEGGSITDIDGGRGGGRTTSGDHGSQGGSAWGIRAVRSDGLLVVGTTISEIVGGNDGRDNQVGDGVAFGLHVEDSPGAFTQHNDVRSIRSADRDSERRQAHGIHLGGANVRSRNDQVFDVAGSPSAAVLAVGAGVRVEQLTAHQLRGAGERYGVWVYGEGTSVTVFNSILSGAADAAFVQSPGASTETLEHVRVWPEDSQYGTPGITADLNVEARDPRFVDAVGGNLALQPNSPCIDVGGGECPEEPPTGDQGPLCDLGHLGDTPDAHPRPE